MKRMKKHAAFLSALVFVFSMVAVAYAGHESMVVPYEDVIFGEQTIMPLPAGGDLRHHITSDDPPYKKWDMWPGTDKMHKGAEPHGALLTTYVNDIALKSIKKMKGMKNHSIIVKENHAPNKKLVAVSVMYKVKGYNPEGGDWFWAQYDADFNILAEGKPKGCLDCHSTASDNDYVFTGKVK
jgi:hypothetical protein